MDCFGGKKCSADIVKIEALNKKITMSMHLALPTNWRLS
jgi:hypothetical protein